MIFENIFPKNGEKKSKNGVFTQHKVKFFNNLVITMFFEKNVIISSTPGTDSMKSGTNPTIVNYNANVVRIYYATNT
jgi:hypothetical protein